MITLASIENLVFQGGSVKGIAYLGALKALTENYLDSSCIKRVAGTSAGAIVAALLAGGYPIRSLENELYDLNFETFLDGKQEQTRELLFNVTQNSLKKERLFYKASAVSNQSVYHPSQTSQISTKVSNAYGIYDGEQLRLKIDDYLYVKTGIQYLTFKELHNLHGKNPAQYKDLFITGVNLSTGFSEVFDYLRTPDLIISDAVRISLSIPLLFKPHTRYIKNSLGHRELSQPEYMYADGGLLDNYPVKIFDCAGFLNSGIAENDNDFFNQVHNPYTLGFRLLSKQHIDYFTGASNAPTTPVNSILTYVKALIVTLNNKQNSDHQLHHDQARTIYIDNLGIDTFAFNLTNQQKQDLMASGEQAVHDFVKVSTPSYVNRMTLP